MNIFMYLYRRYQGERAIRAVQAHVLKQTGQSISREQVIAAQKRWRSRKGKGYEE
jgi:hypothetical protein